MAWSSVASEAVSVLNTVLKYILRPVKDKAESLRWSNLKKWRKLKKDQREAQEHRKIKIEEIKKRIGS